MYHSITEAIRYHAKNQPDKIALADKDEVYSYARLWKEIKTAAGTLKNLGVKQKDAVVVECNQQVTFVIADLACECLGAVFVPLEMGVQEARAEEIYRETKAELLVAEDRFTFENRTIAMSELLTGDSSEYDPQFDSMEFPEEEESEILFSTGTTGKPKGIVLSNRANVAIAENIIYGTEMKKNSVELVPLPLSHSHGLRTCYAHLVNGSTAIVGNGIVNVGIYFNMIEQFGVTALDLTPTMAKVLLKIGKKGLLKIADAIDYIELGTAVLDEETKTELKEIFKGARIYNFYGSTEAGRSCVLDIAKEDLPGCIGYPSKHADIIVTDENHQEIQSSVDRMGLIAVSGGMMMEGYYKSPELTAATLSEGYLYTSDMGYIDEQGRVFVMGRADDVINYKGIKIAPDEIESVAGKYEGVEDCGCVAMADAISGQIPRLFVQVSGEDFDLSSFRVFLKENLEASRVPAKIEIIDKIPRTSNGKILRGELRKR